MKLKDLLVYVFFIALIFVVCINSDFISKSFAEGLQVWYNNLIPVILPFLLISGLFISLIDFDKTNKTASLILLFICGLTCGYPIGAIVINGLYSKGIISESFAYAVMPLCNNISPMFLIGYIYNQYINGMLSLPLTVFVIYIPQLLYFTINMVICFILGKNKALSFKEFAATDGEEASTNIIERSIETITVIGVYICIFSVISNLLFEASGNHNVLQIISCYMEITKGIPALSALINDSTKKTAFILSLASFGGVSSLVQSMHILKQTKLSFFKYCSGKLICCLLTYILSFHLIK